MIGDQVALFAVPIVAVLLVHAGPAEMGLLTAAGLLPSLLFSLPAGVLVDRHGGRRATMLIADAARAGLIGSIPLAYLTGGLGLPQLYGVAFAVGTFDVAFSVADSAFFPLLVRAVDYVEAQALLNGSRTFAGVLGQSLAGLLIAVITAPGALLIDVASFLGSAASLRAIEAEEPDRPSGPAHDDLAGGARFIRQSRVVRSALAATASLNYFTYLFTAIFILYATRSLHVAPAPLGLVLGAGALGGLVGAALTGRLARRIGIGRAFAVGCVAFPVPLALVPLAQGPRWTVLALLFLAEFAAGIGVMLLDITLGAIFAATIPTTMRARVAGAYRTVNYGVRPVGAITGGTLAAAIGARLTLWIAVAGASTSILWVIRTPIAHLRDPATNPPSAAPAPR